MTTHTPKLALVVALLVAGCAQAPRALAPAQPPLPVSWRGAPAEPTASPVLQALADPELDTLRATARQRHPLIAEARAKLAAADAARQAADAARRLQAALSGSVSRQGGPLVNAAGASGTLLTLAAGVSADADLGGRLAGGADAAELERAAAAAELAALTQNIETSLTGEWLALRTLDAERRVQQQAVMAWQDTLAIAERRLELGSTSMASVERLRTELALAQADAAALATQREQRFNAVAAAAGLMPAELTLGERALDIPLPATPAAGVPAALLARRADIAATQARLDAALARAGIAARAWMPELTLGASAGQASPRLADLLAASVRAWSLGLALAQPLFDGGRRDAARAAAQAEVDAASARHQLQLLLACREVEDQLAAVHGLALRAEAQQRALDAARRHAALVEQRRQSGSASTLELLDARRTALATEREQLRVTGAQRQAWVSLVQALGGEASAPAQMAALR